MGSLPPRARLFAAAVTVLTVAVPAVSGASTNTAKSGSQAKPASTVPLILARSTVQGTAGDDYIITKRRSQKVLALAGNDFVRTGSSDDTALGGDGDDELEGNDGRDFLSGGPGSDHPQGGDGNDYVSGGSGDDELDGESGRDRMFAGAGDDEVTGDEGDDIIYPGPGADTIYGEEGDNTVVASDDGVRDDIFCNMITVPTPPGTIIYLEHRDPLDALRNCRVVVKKR